MPSPILHLFPLWAFEALSQGVFKLAMEMRIRDWSGIDLPQIQAAWLDFCRSAARSDMRLRSDSETSMKQWLTTRFRQSNAFGFVAEVDAAFAGFLIGRVDDWESIPPVIEARRIGIIDALYVVEPFRRQRVGTGLIHHAMDRTRDANAFALEAAYVKWNEVTTR